MLLELAAELEYLFSGGHAASLNIAASLAIGEYLLLPVLARWKHGHPNKRVRMLIGNTSKAVESVLDNAD